jgi:aryl-alcohol dehydrogenase-like predicted oxidoreductase
MKKRKLGNSGLELPSLALGGNVFGWTIDEPASFQVLDAFAAAGFNFVDTADMYSTWKPGNKGGESETILGNWMKKSGNRRKVLIATKVGMDMGAGMKGLSKDYILRAAEASLRRLQTDYIDLYQAHTADATLESPITPRQGCRKHWKSAENMGFHDMNRCSHFTICTIVRITKPLSSRFAGKMELALSLIIPWPADF